MAISRIRADAVLQQRLKASVTPSGLINGVNTVYSTTDKWFTETLNVYLNGVKLKEGSLNDYTLSESGGASTGFDTITLTFAPKSGDVVTVGYVVNII